MNRLLGFACTVLLTILRAGSAIAQSPACPALPPPYHGPIFDAAVQPWNPDTQELMASLSATGVARIAMFADSHAGGQTTAAAVEALARANPAQIVLGAPKIGLLRSGVLPSSFVTETLAGVADGRYKFIGEIVYSHGDKPSNRPVGDIHVDPLAAETQRLLQGLAGRNVPVQTHWEAWDSDRDKPAFDRLYAAWPQQKFVLMSLAYGSPQLAEAVLSAHPNVWGTISHIVDGRYHFLDSAKMAKLGPPMIDACGALLPAWQAVLLKYSGRLMFATDATGGPEAGWDVYPRIIAHYRHIVGQLPPDVARKISWDNAASLYSGR